MSVTQQLGNLEVDAKVVHFSFEPFIDEPQRRGILKITAKNTPDEYTTEICDTFVDAYKQVADHKKDFVIIYDFRDYGSLPPMSMCSYFSEKMKVVQPEADKYAKYAVIILNAGFMSSMVKTMVSMFNAVLPPACPMKFVYSDEEKDDFLKVENLYYVEKEAQSE
jgi:hypothetical protein